MKIKGYEDYSIYEDGKIINKKGLERKCYIHNGYKRIDLWKDGKRKFFSLHRLLALHFIENTRPNIATTVDHINRDKLNNNLNNLRWATIEEQNANRYIVPISKGSLSKRNKKTYRYQWCEDRIKKYKSFKTIELAKAFQIEHLKTYHLQFNI
tara:strand:+ start:347 stop:805 length:459 start_codon:yes stop_codon:yes gene_type:complete